MPDDKPTQEQRRRQRHKTLKTGKILLAGGLSVVDCVIRDLSESGARLEVWDNTAVPGSFRLICLADNTMRQAQVVWRNDRRVGVAFTGEVKRAPLLRW